MDNIINLRKWSFILSRLKWVEIYKANSGSPSRSSHRNEWFEWGLVYNEIYELFEGQCLGNSWLPPGDTDIPPRATSDPTHLERFSKGPVWDLLWLLEVRSKLENINVQTRTPTLQPLFWHQPTVWFWPKGITTNIYKPFYQVPGSVMSTFCSMECLQNPDDMDIISVPILQIKKIRYAGFSISSKITKQ